jgi:hypothetical protein
MPAVEESINGVLVASISQTLDNPVHQAAVQHLGEWSQSKPLSAATSMKLSPLPSPQHSLGYITCESAMGPRPAYLL